MNKESAENSDNLENLMPCANARKQSFIPKHSSISLPYPTFILLVFVIIRWNQRLASFGLHLTQYVMPLTKKKMKKLSYTVCLYSEYVCF